MILKPFLFVLIILATISLKANYLFDRLHGITVKKAIYLEWDYFDKSFHYSVDDLKGVTYSFLPGRNTIFNASNQNFNEISIFIKFYNPLKYNFVTSKKEVDDPIYIEVSKFLSSLPNGTELANVASREFPTEPGVLSFTRSKNLSAVNELKSVLLNEWLYELRSLLDTFTITKEINTIQKMDQLLYGKLLDKTNFFKPDNTVIGWIQEEIKKLNNKKTLIDFNEQLKKSEKLIEFLEKNDKEAKAGLDSVLDLLTNDFDNKFQFMKANPKYLAFKAYSRSTAIMIEDKVRFQLKKRTDAIADFKKLIEKLNKFTEKFTEDNYRLEARSIIPYDLMKMNEYKFEMSEVGEKSTDEEKKHTIAFTIAKYQNIIPMFTTSILYTNFSYPNYGITSTNTIKETPSTKVGLRPTAFLNGVFNTKNDWIYPILQIGVTYGKNDVIFPIGAGFILQRNFSLTSGIMIGTVKKLSNLNVGGTVTDDVQLQNDLVSDPIFRWYISINYKL